MEYLLIYIERNITYQHYLSAYELHLADGTTAAVISQLSAMCPFLQ